MFSIMCVSLNSIAVIILFIIKFSATSKYICFHTNQNASGRRFSAITIIIWCKYLIITSNWQFVLLFKFYFEYAFRLVKLKPDSDWLWWPRCWTPIMVISGNPKCIFCFVWWIPGWCGKSFPKTVQVNIIIGCCNFCEPTVDGRNCIGVICAKSIER